MPSTSQLRMALKTALNVGSVVHLKGGIEVDAMTMLSLVRAPNAHSRALK